MILKSPNLTSNLARIALSCRFFLCRKIPSNYKVLFLQGGGTGQFAAVPLNLSRGENPTFDYFVTGTWSQKAAKEAEKYGKVNLVLPKTDKFTGKIELKCFRVLRKLPIL